jgi:hypothetical protein
MLNHVSNKFISTITFLLIVLFTYTAINKLMHFPNFILTISRSSIIGSKAGFIAPAVITVEWLIVILLFFPGLRKIGLLLSSLLLFAFTAYVAYILATEPKLPCSCGGIVQQLSWKNHLILNTVLTILAATAFILLNRKQKTELKSLLQ